MAISEQDRHEMRLGLERALGPEAAATMMEHLPPVGWADVARKRDLDHLEVVTTERLARFEAVTTERFARFEAVTTERFAQMEASVQRDLARLESSVDDKLRQQLQFLVGLQLTAVLAIVGANIGALVVLT